MTTGSGQQSDDALADQQRPDRGELADREHVGVSTYPSLCAIDSLRGLFGRQQIGGQWHLEQPEHDEVEPDDDENGLSGREIELVDLGQPRYVRGPGKGE